MFLHNFKYAFKTLFRDRMLIFWTFAFPLILGTLFQMAFSDIESNEQLDIIEIAVVENEDLSAAWRQSIDALSDPESGDRLFHTRYVTRSEAERLLADKKIDGILELTDSQPQVTVSENGINQTILRYVTDEIAQTETVVQNLAERYDPMTDGDSAAFYGRLYREVAELLQNDGDGIRDASGGHLSYTVIEFYTLIAMTCLYGGILGMTAVNRNLANMGSHGKRVSVGPTSKGQMILGSVLAGYLTQLIGVALLFCYTVFVLRVDYGEHLPQIILLTLCGCLAGLTLGIVIAVAVKANDGVKTGIILSITMAGCFLSGMMGITMKYVIDKNIPWLNLINPAAMITDGFYALYYYDTFGRYWFNIASLLGFSLLMLILSVSGLRRQKYDSI